MKLLFLTVLNITDIKKHGLYEDLLYEFVKNGHDVTVVSPNEKRSGKPTELIEKDGYKILKVYTENIQKTSFIEKGIATVLLPFRYKKAIKKYLDYNDYDLIICSTPPVTLSPLVEYLKNKTNAKVILLLKDIWPQSMVDMKAIKHNGLIYKYFRAKEEKIYKVSDRIGCTSQANIDYVLAHNSIDKNKLMLVTNGLSGDVDILSADQSVFEKYNIPNNKKIFFYGGNLGVPQDIPFIIECIKKASINNNVHFVICGKGTQQHILSDFVRDEAPDNVSLLEYLPQTDYEQVIASADVCMVFLNHNFTIPNCPARFYAYMQGGKPVLAVTDCATDIKEDIEKGGFGWWCASNDSDKFVDLVNEACNSDLKEMGTCSRKWFDQYYTTGRSYETIINAVTEG